MKFKNLKTILLGIVMLILTVLYTYYFRPIVDDELYNYGFGFNIINGLIPYKDFSMIIPPLFSYIVAFILKIFGSKLIVYHFILASIILLILFISYKSIGIKACVIYLLLLIYPYIGYNTFSLGLFFILLYLNDKKHKNLDIIEAVLISLMFLTKQTLLLLVIPSLIFSKNKKKTISVYLVFILGYLIYLVTNGTVLEFFNYCLFGLFDFANKNSTSLGILSIIELLIIGVLIYLSFRTKRKDIIFCLIFQIMALPIINYVHFTISFIPVVYLFLKEYKNNYLAILIFSFTLAIFIFFNLLVRLGNGSIVLNNFNKDNFMEGRTVYSTTNSYIDNALVYIKEYEDYTPYIFGSFAYLMKLNYEIPINKYDIINNGNMGYNGAKIYIEEIDNYCKENKCMFIMNDFEESVSITIQTNMDILKYIQNNYRKVYGSNILSVYIN